MAVDVTRTTASVVSAMTGSGTSVTRTSSMPCQVRALMCWLLPKAARGKTRQEAQHAPDPTDRPGPVRRDSVHRDDRDEGDLRRAAGGRRPRRVSWAGTAHRPGTADPR